MNPEVQAYFDEATFTVSYLVCEPGGTHCAIVDPVLDFDPKSGRTSTVSADRIITDVRTKGLIVDWILETHAHADHLSGAPYLRKALGGRIGIGEHIKQVQRIFKDVFNLESTFNTDGAQFDHLFKDGERFSIGALPGRVLHTPGHTPADLTYVIGDAAFVGDTIFMPDFGTARTDFPGGDAAQLYRSTKKVLALPPETRLYLCHDYKAPGRDEYVWETTVADQRARNVHVRDGISEEEFVAMRTARDAKLAMPMLLLPSVQVNIRGGELPPEEANGVRYLKIPLDAL
ncbi:MBL fold metallo-hydrolase [Sphingomonas parva]|uniref:MBL fold metallo-hydrolase n=1 Tax=Sphingomonas parva TaxID=2555898 RepID=A0A4Y8ZWA2_9SPHN|nr:MBL fold metallo-hydrolase [Sphingomonas parva]TFI59737.1 MBL fold metallo-hydrolase [Sphingomonas parva]